MTRTGAFALAVAVSCWTCSVAFAQLDGRAWVAVGTHPLPHFQSDPVEYNGVVYTVGGWSSAGAGAPILTYTGIGRLDANGNIPSWETGPLFPIPDQGPGLTAASGHLFAAGYDGVLYRAEILADGSLNSWQDLGGVGGAAPGNGRGGRLGVEAYSDNLYVVGGWNGSSLLDGVWMTPIDSNGNIGTWEQLTTLPDGRQHHSVHFVNRRLYVVGGITNSGGITSSVLSAPVNPNGSLGQWREEVAPLPAALWYHNSVTHGQDVIVLGGRKNYPGTDYSVAIYRGSANPADGQIFSWQAVGAIPIDQADGPGAVYLPATRSTYILAGRNPITGEFTGVVRRDKLCYADCNGDGVLNIADFGCFQSKFALGCP